MAAACVQVISEKPRIVVFPNFIDRERTRAIIDEAAQHLRASRVALRKTDDAKSVSNVRTSSGTFMSSDNDPTGVLTWLDERIAAVTGIPKQHFEVRLPIKLLIQSSALRVPAGTRHARK